MTISYPSLTTLNTTDVNTRLTTLSEIVDSLDIGIDTSRGVFRDLVLRMNAVMQTSTDAAMQQIINSVVPGLAADNLDTIDNDIFTAVAESYGVSAITAAPSSGTLLIVVNSSQTVFIPAGATFTDSAGQQYATSVTYAAKLSSVNINYSQDRLLRLRSDGKYEFIIEVSSTDETSSTNVKSGEIFVPASIVIPGYIEATAFTDFSGGRDVESTAEILARIRRAIPAKTLSTRAGLVSFLSQSSLFPTLEAVSVIGTGDVEMLRDKNVMFPGGNKVDVYVRPTVFPTSSLVTLSAICTTVVPNVKSVWTTVIDRDVFPGFYRFTSMDFQNSTEVIKNPTMYRGRNVSALENQQIPTTDNTTQTAFSAFQTASIYFETVAGSHAEGDTENIDITLEGMPDIADIQRAVSSRAHRFVTGDVLVRAAIPCFVSVSIQLNMRSGASDPSAPAIQQAISTYINKLGFSGQIYAVQIAQHVQAMLPVDVFVDSVDIIGEYLLPDGNKLRARVQDVLRVTEDLDMSITNRTVAFYANPNNVQIYIRNELVYPVI